MYKIEFDVDISPEGRFVRLLLPEEHETQPEDKFFAFRFVEYLLHDVYMSRLDQFDDETKGIVQTTTDFIGSISQEISEIVFENKLTEGQTSLMFDNIYNIEVETVMELDKFEHFILYEDKIFNIIDDDVKIHVKETNEIYSYDGKKEEWFLIEK